MIPISHDPMTNTYISDSWKQQSDLILHLSEFSESILLVTAPYQAGKSTFLNQLMQREHPSLNRVKIDAPSDPSVEAIIHLIEENFQDDDRPSALFVDDAHRLSDKQIDALLQLKFHLILIGEPSLELRLFSSRWHDTLQGRIYTIELETWSLDDIKNYWMNDPFAPRLTEEEFITLTEETGGLPGEVTRYKANVLSLENHRENNMFNFNFNLKKMATHPISIGMFIGGLVGGSYLLFSGANEIESARGAMELADGAEEKWENEPFALPEPKVVTATELPQSEMLAAVVQESTPAPAPSVEVVAKTEVKKSLPNKMKAPLTEQEKSLLSLKKNHYTLQLIGARTEKNIQQFISRHGISKEAYCYRTKLSGKDWYVVVYGDYPSREAAKQAMSKIPDSLRKENLKPWVREFDSIHHDIKDHRQA